jgi:hypothetical protein
MKSSENLSHKSNYFAKWLLVHAWWVCVVWRAAWLHVAPKLGTMDAAEQLPPLLPPQPPLKG